MRELYVIEHEPETGAACFEQVLDARAGIAPWRSLDVTRAGAPPLELDRAAALIVMGGTMSAVPPVREDWMRTEIAVLRDAVAAEVPVLGVCLGAQLLGAALGGEVSRRPAPRAGYVPQYRTAAATSDPVFGGWPDGAAALFVHEDQVTTLPPAAVGMLTCDGEVTAWRAGSAWAVQCHPEVDAAQLGRWLEDPDLLALLARAGTDAEALRAEAARRERFTVALGRALVGRFVDAVVRPRVG